LRQGESFHAETFYGFCDFALPLVTRRKQRKSEKKGKRQKSEIKRKKFGEK
jgi:hypothetical protein